MDDGSSVQADISSFFSKFSRLYLNLNQSEVLFYLVNYKFCKMALYQIISLHQIQIFEKNEEMSAWPENPLSILKMCWLYILFYFKKFWKKPAITMAVFLCALDSWRVLSVITPKPQNSVGGYKHNLLETKLSIKYPSMV